MQVATKEAFRLFHDGTLAMAQMERNGMRIDVDYLDRTTKEVTQKIRDVKDELRKDKVYTLWRKKYGERANLGSLDQLAQIVFGELKYPSKGVTATGRFKADEEAFEDVDLPFVAKYRTLKKLEKVNKPYLSNLRNELVGEFIHPSFNLNSVASYRSSCSNPNAQNIPTRDPVFSKYVRTAFIPRKGRRLVESDFKGAEVSVAACYNHDPVLINYIKDPKSDMHRDTATQLFLLPDWQPEYKKTFRDAAKNRFVFPEFYGSVYFQCAPDLWKGVVDPTWLVKVNGEWITIKKHLRSKGIYELGDCAAGGSVRNGTFEHLVRQVEEDFWNRRFKVYTRWKNKVWADYQKTAEMLTYTGFRIAGPMRRNQVLNFPIQGSAFHCLLWSLIKVQKWLNKNKMKTLLTCQIHDSLIADSPEDEIQDYLGKLKEIITVDLPKVWDWIVVPLIVEAETTAINGNWYEKQGIQL